MVDIDPDWQVASEIFGMKLKIDGVLEARFMTSAIQSPKRRGRNVYAGLKRWANRDEIREKCSP